MLLQLLFKLLLCFCCRCVFADNSVVVALVFLLVVVCCVDNTVVDVAATVVTFVVAFGAAEVVIVFCGDIDKWRLTVSHDIFSDLKERRN